MKKQWFAGLWLFFVLLLVPTSAFAADENPITKFKDKMKMQWGLIDDAGWLFKIVMIGVTGLVIALFVACIIGVIWHVYKVLRAQRKFGDKVFWGTEIGCLFIVIMYMTGAYLDVFENFYNFTDKQKIGEETTSMLMIPNPQSPWESFPSDVNV